MSHKPSGGSRGSDRLDEPVRFPRWGEDRWHDHLVLSRPWLKQKLREIEDAPEQRFHRLIEFREAMATDLRATQSTFSQSDIVDGGSGKALEPEIYTMAGTWRPPEELIATYRCARFVNPAHSFAHIYSDAMVVCECGAAMRRLRDEPEPEHRLPGERGHRRDCDPDTAAADPRLRSKRRELYETMELLCCPDADIVRRLGFDPETWGLPEILDSTGISTHTQKTLRREGRRRLIRTLLVLLRSYSPEEVAPIYRLDPRTVRNLVDVESTTTAAALGRVRSRRQSRPSLPAHFSEAWCPRGRPAESTLFGSGGVR